MKIELKHVAKSFSGLPVLRDISLTFRDGGCCCPVNPSGSGEVALPRILMELEQPSERTLKADIEPAVVSAVFQEDRLCESFSSVENITICTDRSMKAPRVRWGMIRLFSRECLSRPVSALSDGTKRWVTVLRALLIPSHVLLVDEPFAGMDKGLKRSVIAYIREKQGGRILILSTH